MRASSLLLVVVVLLALSSVMGGSHRLKSKIAAKNEVKNNGNSCTYLGVTQQCSVWCTENCGGPCSNCEEESGNVCACDDLPALNDKKLVKEGNSCTYLGVTQQCSVWCTENCGAPCSSCESESGNECACDDVPALNDKKLIEEKAEAKQGYSCSYLGVTQDCATWCTDNCGAPCSSCFDGSDDVVCMCDEVPAINDKKLIKDAPQGNSCTYLGATQQCSVWCTENCGGPCSNCENESGNECACDDLPALNDKKLIEEKTEAKQGYSCSYLGVTQDCATWCTDNCGAPCSSCFDGSDDVVCMCDEVPAINDIAIKNGVKVKDAPAGNSCTYLGATQQCSVWCTENCGGPCSNCENESGNECACDDLPALNDKKL